VEDLTMWSRAGLRYAQRATEEVAGFELLEAGLRTTEAGIDLAQRKEIEQRLAPDLGCNEGDNNEGDEKGNSPASCHIRVIGASDVTERRGPEEMFSSSSIFMNAEGRIKTYVGIHRFAPAFFL
jgi:hypothetical protein